MIAGLHLFAGQNIKDNKSCTCLISFCSICTRCVFATVIFSDSVKEEEALKDCRQDVCRVVIILRLFLFLLLCSSGQVSAIIDEDSDHGPSIEARMMLPPEAEKKYTEFMAKVEADYTPPKVPEGSYKFESVRIVGDKLLSDKAIKDIADRYRGQPLDAKQLQQMMVEITAACHAGGWITSRADFAGISSDGVLSVWIIANRIGKITVQGNRFFSKEVMMERLDLNSGDIFNLNDLQYGAFKISKNMDRKAKIDLAYSKDDQLTDIMINVKDKPPMHLTMEMDTYGSWFIKQNRYRVIAIHNNLTGHDDSIQLKMQWADNSAHELMDFSYRLPLGNRWWWEMYFMPYKAEDYFYGLEGVHKRAWKTYSYMHYNFVDKPKKSVVGEIGFVYKHINWEKPLGTVQAEDHFSGFLLGVDMDFVDSYGRTIITDDFEVGIPGLFGATEDGVNECSVPGADGKYVRNHIVLARRQKLFEGFEFLFKSHAQCGSGALTGVNAFSIGGFFGVIDMRGYPRAQAYGENGLSFSSGFAFAPYFLPKDWKVPGSVATFYKSTQFFTLIDWATVSKLKPELSELEPQDDAKSVTLYSAVAGVQMMLPEAFLFRLEFGWPLSDLEPTDGKDYHTWMRISKTF